MSSILFSGIRLGNLAVSNRLVRSATYEGAADAQGRHTAAYGDMYEDLASSGVGLIITVGGMRSKTGMESAIMRGQADLIAMSRPFLNEPRLAEILRRDDHYESTCTNCNQCVLMCDSGRVTRCYRRTGTAHSSSEGQLP